MDNNSSRKCSSVCQCNRHKQKQCPQGCECGRHSKETRAKISQAQKGKQSSPESIAKKSEALRRFYKAPLELLSPEERARRQSWKEVTAAANRKKAQDPIWREKVRQARVRNLPSLESPTKTCPACKTEKDKSKFNRNRRSRDGLQYQCRECQIAHSREAYEGRKHLDAEWRAKNKERIRNTLLMRNYGLTAAEYDRLLAVQLGLCAICEQPETSKHQSGKTRMLAVDHDHVTGKIRGLLCGACNLAIGQFREHPERLANAIKYLRKNK